MKTFRSRVSIARLRQGFIFLTALGLLFNLVFDLIAYNKINQVEVATTRVVESYRSVILLHELEIAVERFLTPPDLPGEQEKVLEKILQLRTAVVTTPALLQNLAMLETDVISKRGPHRNEEISVLNRMFRVQTDELNQEVDKNNRNNAFIRGSLSDALFFDGLLFLIMFFVFIIDVDYRNKIEEALSLTIAKFNEANIAPQSQNLVQSRHLKMVVHDLKNPLGSISGFAEILAEETKGQQSSLELANRIRRISFKTVDMISQFLTGETQQEVQLRSVNLVKILDEVYQESSVIAHGKSQILERDFSLKEAFVEGDETKLHDLFLNLVSNGLKYSPAGKRISMHLSREGKYFRVDIQDEGPGFSEEDIKKAFQFGQTLTAKPTQNESSTGYGLYIAKHIVDLHRGKIAILSPEPSGKTPKKERGACLRVELADNGSFH